jgi:hypothetical protein
MQNNDDAVDEAVVNLSWATYADICRIGQKKTKFWLSDSEIAPKIRAHHEAILQAFYFFEQIINSIVEENRDGIRAEAIEAQAEQKSKEQDQVSAPVVENGDEQAAPDQP